MEPHECESDCSDPNNPDPDAERINVPAITPYYWRYRMHLALDELVAADEFNSNLSRLLKASGRAAIG